MNRNTKRREKAKTQDPQAIWGKAGESEIQTRQTLDRHCQADFCNKIPMIFTALILPWKGLF
jgi:hypothetical protein